MKAAAFDYVRPDSLELALAELDRDPDETKILAGGQSLIPMMNFRLARPSRLVDINRVPGLSGVTLRGDSVTIGACTRHLELQQAQLPGPLGNLVRQSAVHIGHLPIRTRGTFGGSLAHCDAASEWCLIATLLDARIEAVSRTRGSRTIPASEFFQSVFTTALEPDEILTAATLPCLDASWTAGMAEFTRRAGDFAIVAAACAVQVNDGIIGDARVCLGGVSEIPARSPAAESVMIGQPFDPALLTAAAEAAAEASDPPSDINGDASYRRDLIRALLPRAVGPPEETEA